MRVSRLSPESRLSGSFTQIAKYSCPQCGTITGMKINSVDPCFPSHVRQIFQEATEQRSAYEQRVLDLRCRSCEYPFRVIVRVDVRTHYEVYEPVSVLELNS